MFEHGIGDLHPGKGDALHIAREGLALVDIEGDECVALLGRDESGLVWYMVTKTQDLSPPYAMQHCAET
ncbi:hypothetical protein WN982_39895 [Paraburkholderia sp. IMGN_8]|uniref:hypothetical protein n=1 Tax=Paraburkholderia sp. IMGN_8 TaxID=3136564 RepID=UPI0031019B6A